MDITNLFPDEEQGKASPEQPQKALKAEGAPLEFPIEKLPPAAQDVAREIARTRLLPPDLPSSLALVTAAAAIGKGLELDIPPHRTRPNIFLLATARSGTGKSDCFRDLTAPLYLAEEQANDAHESTRHRKAAEVKLLEAEMGKIKGHSEESINKLADLSEKHEAALKALHPRRIIIEDSTEPAMKQAFANNREQLALMSAEGGQVVSNLLGRYGDAKGQTSDTVALKAFSGDSDTQARMGTGETRLKSPCLTIALIVTPDKARELFMNPRFVEGGLMPRFLIATSDARPKHDDGTKRRPDAQTLGRWQETILELVATYRNAAAPAVIQCEPEALEVFRNYWNEEFVDCFDEIESDSAFYARHLEQAKRLAVTLHALKHGKDACRENLTAETATDALAFVAWFIQNQEGMIAAARIDRTRSLLDRIADIAANHGEDAQSGRVVTLRNLKRNGIKAGEVRAITEQHPNKYAIEMHKTGGRTSPRLVLKP
jgi:hypothetical protein